MAKTQAVYYRSRNGTEPVLDFLEVLSPRPRATLALQIDRLNRLPSSSPPLPFPHSSQVAGSLRELRCHYGSDLYRVLYRRSEDLIVLLHIFQKSTAAIPQGEIDTAEARWDDFKRRMDATSSTPPRAAGHDAP